MRFWGSDDLQLETKSILETCNICPFRNAQKKPGNTYLPYKDFSPHPASNIYFLGTQPQGRNNNQRKRKYLVHCF